MPRFVVLLRAVNLGGDSTLRMDGLRAAVVRLGFESPRTWLQSGNLIVDSPLRSSEEVERALEDGLVHAGGTRFEFLARSASEWREIVAQNPYPMEAAEDPAHLVVTVLKRSSAPVGWDRLREAISGRERFAPGGRHAYIVYPDGIGRSRLTTERIERALGVRVTSRNWSTARRLDEMARADPART